MEKEYKIAESIHHYIVGEATEREIQEVEAWLAANEQHKVMIEKFRSESYISGQLPEYEVFDVNKAYERFRKNKRTLVRRHHLYRWSSVAAILFILLGCIYLLTEKQRNVEHSAQTVITEVLHPGSSRAVLILEGGEEVLLGDSLHNEFEQQAAKVEITGEQMYYSENINYTDTLIPSNNTVVTSRGGEYRLTLADGTKVWLNAESRIEFPVIFNGHQREVYVKGEVYFEVAKDSLHPFVVNTDKAKIKVLGTSFNVRAYPDEAYRTTLINGSVEVICREEIIRLIPNEQWILNGEVVKVMPVDSRVVSGWVNGSFAFEEELLPDVFQELERWYDVHVFITNEKIKEMRFTGIFPRYGNMEKVLEIIEIAAGVQCRVNGRTIIIGMI